MRICYVANSRFPSERAHMTQIVHMCNAFVSLGHEVTLMVTDRKTDITESPEDFYGVPILFSREQIQVPDIAGRAQHIPLSLRPVLFSFQRLVFAFRAALSIQKGEYTHVYGRDEWVLLFLYFFVRAKIVWESHEARFGYIARFLVKRISSIVVISEGIRDYYRAQGVEDKKIYVAHDAIDERFFSPHVSQEYARALLSLSSDKPIVLYVGGLDAWKGVGTLFDPKAHSESFQIVVVGGKESELALAKNIYPHVQFLGPRPYRELPVVQQAADILVIPNTGKNPVSAEYTSPLKLFAYMTSRIPIVASDIPSIRRIVTDAEVYFCAPDDPLSLRETIQDVLQNSKEAHLRAERAFQKSYLYTWKTRADHILKNL